ncbi:MAG TPA: hypothetical protein VK453_00105 [Micromonosporaceae bacterium]|nr:hypothetical protein [Micromonosporaceae bacterium]
MTPALAGGSTVETGLRTEFAFDLPVGYLDDNGQVHRQGTMRMARARDEIAPLRDPRVRDNEAYLTVLLLSRTITRIGDVTSITPNVIEGLFAADLAFLQDLYRRVNQEGHTRASVSCPSCRTDFTVDVAGGAPGES